MPSTYTVADILLGPDSLEVKPVLCKIRKADADLIASVFPEAGTQTYLAGCFYRKLADRLRSDGITTVSDRVTNSSFKTLKDLTDHVQFRKPATRGK